MYIDHEEHDEYELIGVRQGMAKGRKSLKDKMRLAILTERIDVAGPEVAIFKFRPKGW